MKKPKTSPLRGLLRNFYTAAFSEKVNQVPVKKLIEMSKKDQISRRKFINSLSKAGLFVGLTSTIPMLNSCEKEIYQNTTKNTPNIAIIGGGIAGLKLRLPIKKTRNKLHYLRRQ